VKCQDALSYWVFLFRRRLSWRRSASSRRPRGVYTLVNVEDGINQEQRANPAITTAQLDIYFNNYYQGLLNNPAIAGLTLQVHWDTLNTNPPVASNSYLLELLGAASQGGGAPCCRNFENQAARTAVIIRRPRHPEQSEGSRFERRASQVVGNTRAVPQFSRQPRPRGRG
jgi:hypothetical protein